MTSLDLAVALGARPECLLAARLRAGAPAAIALLAPQQDVRHVDRAFALQPSALRALLAAADVLEDHVHAFDHDALARRQDLQDLADLAAVVARHHLHAI